MDSLYTRLALAYTSFTSRGKLTDIGYTHPIPATFDVFKEGKLEGANSAWIDTLPRCSSCWETWTTPSEVPGGGQNFLNMSFSR